MLTTKKPSRIVRALAPLLVVYQTLAGYALLAAQQQPTADIKVDINAGSGGGAWYQEWWVWVLVGLFALIVIVALTQRGKTTVVKGS